MASAFKSLKVQDVKELQELVAESVEAVEPGMRLLDTRVVLGGATIDVVALDTEDRLTLIALGLGAEDEMILRGLEAYSWCLEYPDGVRRLYPSVQVSESRPPRVIFVSEKVPDAFLRKVKHLRLARAECLEFRFGLQFKAVDDLRGAGDTAPPERPNPTPRAPAALRVAPRPSRSEPDPRPAAASRGGRPEPEGREPAVARAQPDTREVAAPRAAPAPRAPRFEAEAAPPVAARVTRPEAPRVEPARAEARRDPESEVAEVHAQMLEQLRATTTTVGEWREAAVAPAAEVDDGKVRIVRDYLQREFPTAVIYDFYAHDRGVQMFHLQDSHGALIHSAAVGEDLLEEGSDAELGGFLEKHKLARVLRQAGSAGVSVTRSGLKIERR